jgi:hypothetical protein
MAGKQLSDGNPTGTTLGQSTTDLIAFYGVTPVAQPASASQAAITTSVVSSFSTAGPTVWGFASGTQAAAAIALLNILQSNLVTLGLIKGSA